MKFRFLGWLWWRAACCGARVSPWLVLHLLRDSINCCTWWPLRDLHKCALCHSFFFLYAAVLCGICLEGSACLYSEASCIVLMMPWFMRLSGAPFWYFSVIWRFTLTDKLLYWKKNNVFLFVMFECNIISLVLHWVLLTCSLPEITSVLSKYPSYSWVTCCIMTACCRVVIYSV